MVLQFVMFQQENFMQHGINETNNFEKLLDEMSRFTPAEIIANDLLYEST